MIIQSLAMRTIRLARRLVVNTPIQRWGLTTAVYRWVFRRACPPGEVTAAVYGLQLTFPSHDITIAPGLLGGFYEQLEVDAFVRLAKLSHIVIDVGGNLGLYACLAAKALPADGTVVTFEPVPDNLNYLRRNVAQNPSAARVLIEPVAVGAHEGKVTIHLSKSNVGTHSVSLANVGPTLRQLANVPVATIDSYLADRLLVPVDLLKVDVEGYDCAVLQGAAETIKRDRPALFVEYGPAQLSNCGFDPAEFLDIIFDNYRQVLLVDEPRQSIRPCMRSELTRLGNKKVMFNLICLQRDDQLAALAR